MKISLLPAAGLAINWPLILVIGSCLVTETAQARDWRFSSGAATSLIFTDNVNQDSSDEENDLVLVITPYLTLHRERGGAKVSADSDLTVALEYNSHTGGSLSLNPRLQANTGLELVKDSVFFDARATSTQNIIDPLSSSGFDTLSEDNDNVTTTYSYSLSPWIINRLGRFAGLTTRYTFTDVINTGRRVSDSNSHAVALDLDSGPDFQRFSWNLTGAYRKTDFSSGEDNTLRSADVRLGYRFNRKWRASGSVGREWNDFVSDDSDIDGERWDFRIGYTPNPRTSIDIGFGDRFFGSTPSLTIQRRHRRSRFSVSYSRELTDTNTLLSSQDVFQESDPFGQPFNPVTGDPQPITTDLTRLSDSVIVDERVRATYSLQGRRTTLTLSGDHSKQEAQDTQEEIQLMGSGISLNRRLTKLMSSNLSFDWRREKDEDDFDTDTWRFRVNLSRELSPGSNLRFGYSHIKRDSDLPDEDYDENRLTLTLNIDLLRLL